jgi:hypothetical protein
MSPHLTVSFKQSLQHIINPVLKGYHICQAPTPYQQIQLHSFLCPPSIWGSLDLAFRMRLPMAPQDLSICPLPFAPPPATTHPALAAPSLLQTYYYEKAVKADYASLPIDLWNDRLWDSSNHSPTNKAAFTLQYHRCPLDYL